MKYMLDTNICIGLIRQKPQKLIRRLTRCEPGEVGASSITIAELAYGANKSNQVEQNLFALEQFLLPLKSQILINKHRPFTGGARYLEKVR
jgi:tRNA(fMet)-specific endonuclease VapC